MDRDELRREVPFHQSLARPDSFMGGDRRLVLGAAVLSAILILVLQHWWSILLGLLLWWGAKGAAQRMGKADPYMINVYSLHNKYKRFYPAKSGLRYTARQLPKDWKPKILG